MTLPYTNSITLDLIILIYIFSWYSIIARDKLKDRKRQKLLKEEIKKEKELIEQLQKEEQHLKVVANQSRLTELTFDLIKTNYNWKMFFACNLPSILLFGWIGLNYNQFGRFFNVFGLFSIGLILFHLIFGLLIGFINRKIYRHLKNKYKTKGL
jgi:uncharacterized membrane protein (DUF106 family)